MLLERLAEGFAHNAVRGTRIMRETSGPVCTWTGDIPTAVLDAFIWKWHTMPYLVLKDVTLRLMGRGAYERWDEDVWLENPEIDEWSTLLKKP